MNERFKRLAPWRSRICGFFFASSRGWKTWKRPRRGQRGMSQVLLPPVAGMDIHLSRFKSPVCKYGKPLHACAEFWLIRMQGRACGCGGTLWTVPFVVTLRLGQRVARRWVGHVKSFSQYFFVECLLSLWLYKARERKVDWILEFWRVLRLRGIPKEPPRNPTSSPHRSSASLT